MAKNDFQYGGWKSYTLQCGTITTIAAGAPPRTSLGELTALPRPSSCIREGRRERDGRGGKDDRKGEQKSQRRGGEGREGRRRNGKGGERNGPPLLGQVYAPGAQASNLLMTVRSLSVPVQLFIYIDQNYLHNAIHGLLNFGLMDVSVRYLFIRLTIFMSLPV